MERKILLNLIGLIGLTLTSVFIQISNESINSYNMELFFDMQSNLHLEHVALSELITLIGYDTRELVGNYPSELNINSSIKNTLEKYVKNAEDASLISSDINLKLKNPPKCFGLDCSITNSLLYGFQILIIFFMVCLNIKIK